MKRSLQRILAATILCMFAFSTIVMAAEASISSYNDDSTTISINGQTFTGYSSAQLDGDTDGFVSVGKINGKTYYMQPGDATAFKTAQDSQALLDSHDIKTLDEITKEARGEVQSISGVMVGLKPDVDQGASVLSGLQGGYTLILSCILWIGWALFLGTELFNGLVVAVPGLYDNIVGNEAAGGMGGYGMGGGQKKKSFLASLLSKNTRKVMGKQGGGGMGMGMGGGDEGEEPIKEWFKGEIPRIVGFVIIAVCLFNGLLFKLMDFVLGVFKFGA